MSLEDIVKVSITKETNAVSQASFGTPMILGASKAFPERVRVYSDLKGVAEDFTIDSKEYLAATAIFSQEPCPQKVAIGRRQVTDVFINLTEARPLTRYYVQLNDVQYAYTSAETNPTISAIVAGLITAINTATTTHGVNAIAVTDKPEQIQLQSTNPEGSYSLRVSNFIAIDQNFVATANIAEDLNRIQEADDTWYALIITSRDEQDIIDTAEWTETQKKMFGACTSDPAVANTSSPTDVTTIAYRLKSAGYARTFLIYHALPDEFPEAAMFSKCLSGIEPGENTWMFKNLASVSTRKFTETQQANLRAKNVNFYIELGGRPITYGGIVVSGEFCDIIIGCDWLQSRLTEAVFSALVNRGKLPFTDTGIAVIETQIKAVLTLGIQNQLIASDPAFEIKVPKARDIPFNDKARRELNGVTFKAYLQGAIHAVFIRGVITL